MIEGACFGETNLSIWGRSSGKANMHAEVLFFSNLDEPDTSAMMITTDAPETR